MTDCKSTGSMTFSREAAALLSDNLACCPREEFLTVSTEGVRCRLAIPARTGYQSPFVERESFLRVMAPLAGSIDESFGSAPVPKSFLADDGATEIPASRLDSAFLRALSYKKENSRELTAFAAGYAELTRVCAPFPQVEGKSYISSRRIEGYDAALETLACLFVAAGGTEIPGVCMMEDEQKWWRENIKDTVARVPGLSERLAETRAAVAAYKAKPGATIHVFPR